MKYLFLLLVLIPGVAKAQKKVDYNAIIIPQSATGDIDFSEKLVQIAWQNSPHAEILNHQINASNYRVKQSKWAWLEKVGVQGNLNEFNIHQTAENSLRSQFYPKYNVYANISLSAIFTDPVKTKIEKENLQSSIAAVNEEKLALRAEVLSKYQTYQSNSEIVKVRTQIMNQAEEDRIFKEKKFADGQLSNADFNAVNDRYNQIKIDLILAQKDLNLSRIDLESVIGVKLADVR